MFCKTFFLAFLAVGALAVKLELSDSGRTTIKTKLTSFCAQAGGGDADHSAELATKAVQSFFDCMNPLIDTDTVKEEIEDAQTNGTIGEVVMKYCVKTPDYKTCLHKLSDGLSPCVEEGAKDQLNLIKSGVDKFIDYSCNKDGKKITEFVTANGIECFNLKADDIKTCVQTFGSKLSGFQNPLSLPVAQKCGLIDDLATCTVKVLETCTTPTTGNIVQSLYSYVREGTACNDALPLPK